MHETELTLPAHAIEFRNVSRTHTNGAETIHALANASFTINQGELVAIMGSSGSGKTTLLNLAGGLDSPTEGEVLINGTSLTTASPRQLAQIRRNSVGYVFQNFNLIPSLNVSENVALPLELDGMAASEAVRAAHNALETIGIAQLSSRFPSDLSGGQAQRAAIARALVGTRSILLADEPTGALDSRTSDGVINILRERADAGTTVVLVTHEARLAAWADRVLYLKDGHIIDESGSAQ